MAGPARFPEVTRRVSLQGDFLSWDLAVAAELEVLDIVKLEV